jgi:hypothetical protein
MSTPASSPFALRTLLIIIAIGGCAVAGLVYLSLYGKDFGEPLTAEASAFSRSSIGHKAFFETLRRLGLPVQVSRFGSLSKASASDVLVVAEPAADADNDNLLERLDSVPQALLVLPKWQAAPDPADPHRALALVPVPDQEVLAIYKKAMGSAKLVRHQAPVVLPAGRFFEGAIKITQPQFLDDDDLKPLISGTDGILLGEYARGGTRLWVLSDPDLLSNQGIDEADNAAVAVGIMMALKKQGGRIIFDEAIHGFGESPALLRKIFELPYVIVTGTAAIVILFLVWAGSARFGAPQQNEAVLVAGKGTLVRNAADLLSLGKSAGMVLSSYLRTAISDAMRELRGPGGLDEAAQAGWLDRQAQRRGLALRLAPLRDASLGVAQAHRPDMRQALRLAIDIHHWKQEMLNGTGGGSGAG